MFKILNYYCPSIIEMYVGASEFKEAIANLCETIGQLIGLLEVKLSNKY